MKRTDYKNQVIVDKCKRYSKINQTQGGISERKFAYTELSEIALNKERL
ncbi:hypothetical protein KAW65_05960 [candidate division WOR-3 bacterium]|nr:hypothetical protein [candidate division WOR-3 bacterium]